MSMEEKYKYVLIYDMLPQGFHPTSNLPGCKNLEKNLELHENNLCKRAMTRYSRYSTKKRERIENKGKVATG